MVAPSLIWSSSNLIQEIHPQFLRILNAWAKNEKAAGIDRNPGTKLSTLLRPWSHSRSNLELAAVGPRLWPADDRPQPDNRPSRCNWRLSIAGTSPIPPAPPIWKAARAGIAQEFRNTASPNKRNSSLPAGSRPGRFQKAWQDQQYRTIIEVAEKIPDAVLQEDSKLLMWYDQA